MMAQHAMPRQRVVWPLAGAAKPLFGALALLLVPAFVLSPRALAQSGEVPRLEFASGCRDSAGGDKGTLDRCIGDEEKARAKLATEWGAFPHGDRTSCTQLARLGGGLQSYVELLTCLEMAKEARRLPKE